MNNTPLHLAVLYGQLNVVQHFVEELACDPNLEGMYGYSSATLACLKDHNDIVEYLLVSLNCVPDTSADKMTISQSEINRIIPLKYSHFDETKTILRLSDSVNSLCQAK